jgi:hypothetical protein
MHEEESSMMFRSKLGLMMVVSFGGLVSAACAAEAPTESGPTETASSLEQALDEALPPAASGKEDKFCKKVEPKDVLIAQLMKDALREDYSLTQLAVDASGNITGPSLPATVQGSLEIVNSVPEARLAVARALVKVSGLPPYHVEDVGEDIPACASVPAWSPTGTVNAATTANWVHVAQENRDSWVTTHREFGKQCQLVRRLGNRDLIDPPGDGSTNAPPSATVSTTGVVADSFGRCPTGSSVGSYCKLSYATGVNYTGRWCQYYYGSLKCVLKP